MTTVKFQGLRALFEDDDRSGVRPDLAVRCLARLDAIDWAASLEELAVPGYRLHRLKGEDRWSIRVNGAWRITFAWDGKNARAVDLEQYH